MSGRDRGTCRWCGLPVGSAAAGSEVYCCFGCRFAASVAESDADSETTRRAATRLGIAAFFAMNVMVFSMALWSEHIYDAGSLQPLERALRELFGWLAFVTTVPVLLLLGGPLAESAWEEWRRGRPSIDVLIGTGVAGAFLLSVWHLFAGGPLYFEVAAMVLVLVTLGRWIDACARLQAGRLLDRCGALLPRRTHRLGESGPQSVPPEALIPGDRILVAPGERLAVDAVLESPERAEFDARLLTGESRPVVCTKGEPVAAGAVLVSGEAVLRVARGVGQSRLAQLLEATRRARQQRGRMQRMAERLTPWFAALVAVVAATAFGIHLTVHGLEAALLASLSVALIACPCALTLATSVAVWTALRRAAEAGVLLRGGETLERLAAVKAICFDKTGTLTADRPAVRAALDARGRPLGTDAAALAWIGAAIRVSRHPYARAIADYLQAIDPQRTGPEQPLAAHTAPDSGPGDSVSERPFEPKAGEAPAARYAPHGSDALAGDGVLVQTIPGRGLRVTWPAGWPAPLAAADGTPGSEGSRLQHRAEELKGRRGPDARRALWIGSERLTVETGCFLEPELRDALRNRDPDDATVLVGHNGRVIAAFVIDDRLRPEAASALAMCRRAGLHLGVLSGDAPPRVARLGKELSVEAVGGCSAEQKAHHLKNVRATVGPVAMVGDGFNDATALAAADVAVAMAAGVDLTRLVADACLLDNDLRAIPWAVQLARRTRRIIRQNLLWCFGYNTAGMLLAAAGRLDPVLAAVLMFASSMLVLINSRRAGTLAHFNERPSRQGLAAADPARESDRSPPRTRMEPSTEDAASVTATASVAGRAPAPSVPGTVP